VAELLFGSLIAFAASRAALAAEILALRHQLAVLERSSPARRPFTCWDRALWAFALRHWSGWKDSLVLVKPESVVQTSPIRPVNMRPRGRRGGGSRGCRPTLGAQRVAAAGSGAAPRRLFYALRAERSTPRTPRALVPFLTAPRLPRGCHSCIRPRRLWPAGAGRGSSSTAGHGSGSGAAARSPRLWPRGSGRYSRGR
jgi:hypothetical protein